MNKLSLLGRRQNNSVGQTIDELDQDLFNMSNGLSGFRDEAGSEVSIYSIINPYRSEIIGIFDWLIGTKEEREARKAARQERRQQRKERRQLLKGMTRQERKAQRKKWRKEARRNRRLAREMKKIGKSKGLPGPISKFTAKNPELFLTYFLKNDYPEYELSKSGIRKYNRVVNAVNKAGKKKGFEPEILFAFADTVIERKYGMPAMEFAEAFILGREMKQGESVNNFEPINETIPDFTPYERPKKRLPGGQIDPRIDDSVLPDTGFNTINGIGEPTTAAVILTVIATLGAVAEAILGITKQDLNKNDLPQASDVNVDTEEGEQSNQGKAAQMLDWLKENAGDLLEGAQKGYDTFNEAKEAFEEKFGQGTFPPPDLVDDADNLPEPPLPGDKQAGGGTIGLIVALLLGTGLVLSQDKKKKKR